MKKVLILVCIGIMMFAMVGCGNDVQGVFERSRLRVDIATAAQIGKAVKIWDDEYNSDTNFKNSVESSGSVLSTEWIKVSDLGKIEDFVYIDSSNLVLEDADYYVAKTSDESYKIVVGISNNNGTDLLNPSEVTEIEEYTGASSAIVWLESDENNN